MFNRTAHRSLKKIGFILLFLQSFLVYANELDFYQYCKSESKKHIYQVQNANTNTRAFFKQWFMGPLITPSPITSPTNEPSISTGVIQYIYYGKYKNNWSVRNLKGSGFYSTEFFIYPQVGITKHIGTEAFASMSLNYNRKKSYTQFQDIIYRIGYQILIDKLEKGSWTPNLRLIFQETFPVGKYRRLDPDGEGIDATGQGAFQSGVLLAWQKGFKYNTKHAFNLAGAVGYFILSSVKIKGVSIYGGNNSTQGIAYPGNIVTIFSSGEFELTRHIALSYDSNFLINFAGKYKSKIRNGSKINVSQMAFLNFAPEIEIIISKKAGFLIGPWFTITGQNAPAYASFFIAFLYLF